MDPSVLRLVSVELPVRSRVGSIRVSSGTVLACELNAPISQPPPYKSQRVENCTREAAYRTERVNTREKRKLGIYRVRVLVR